MSSDPTTDLATLLLIPVEPQPDYIESSGRWHWPLPKQACFPGCCTSVVTASREWWEYAPSEAKPHPFAEGVQLRDDRWYWAIPRPTGWRPIDTAPSDGTEFIAFHKEAGVCACFRTGPESAWYCMDGWNTYPAANGTLRPGLTSFVTPPECWMPMPEGPK